MTDIAKTFQSFFLYTVYVGCAACLQYALCNCALY